MMHHLIPEVDDPLTRAVLEERLRLERLHTYLPTGQVIRPVDAHAQLLTERTHHQTTPRRTR